ncbi:hypothetical protein NVV95_16535 [Herbiconiux sp. CPCC 205716]|uniref:Integral membrane protein n=1 Tax=Herbiconiux gentiana TaxID=2970912 RepID=A0ABT2GIV0_9MICO|nr:hypothetical protein [Herbiconiux gentiana]MCS5716155.1 hypothetical protein [Herbiconiux gentiana]
MGRTSRATRGLTAAGLILILLGAFLTLALLVPSNYKGSTYKCIVEGPYSEAAEVSERPDGIAGAPSLWPIGRSCTWAAATGDGTVTTYSGSWPGTFVVVCLITIGTALLVARSMVIRWD